MSPSYGDLMAQVEKAEAKAKRNGEMLQAEVERAAGYLRKLVEAEGVIELLHAQLEQIAVSVAAIERAAEVIGAYPITFHALKVRDALQAAGTGRRRTGGG